MTISLIFAAFSGLAIGSFLNVVIYRVPRNESVVTPRSHCVSCDGLLTARDTIPVVSWLVLKGRCRQCGERVSARYLILESLTAVLIIGTVLRLGPHWNSVIESLFVASLIALAAIDLEHYLLPRRIVYSAAAVLVGLMVAATLVDGQWRSLLTALGCAAVWSGLFLAIHVISPRMLGFGDVRFALLLGLGLGWLGVRVAVLGFLLAGIIGSVIGITLIATKRIDRTTPLPFGVFLSVGAVAAVYAAPLVVQSI